MNHSRKDYKGIEPIGVGSSRMVFELKGSKDRVIKFTRGRTAKQREKGIEQNTLEFDLYHHLRLPILCPVIEIANDASYIIMKKAIPLGKKYQESIPEEYKQKVKEFQSMMGKMYKLFKMIEHDTPMAEFKKEKRVKPYLHLFDHVLFHQIFTLVFAYDMIRGDLFRKTSWGLLDGEFVLIDYGLSRDIYNQYYSKKKKHYGYMEGLV